MAPTEPQRILIATTSVSGPSGTDLYTRDLALALLRRGHLPVVYASHLGALADELRRATIPVVDDVRSIAARPDVIQGHHTLETLTALSHFPDVPALFVGHDSLSWHSIPPRCSRIVAWVAVDRNCRDRMMFEHGVPEASIRVLTNAVDLERFRRREPLPVTPRRALVFNNAATETGYVAHVRAACAARGIHVDVAGELSGNPASRPEQLLPSYDVVFARARCALEAAAVGNAVIVCDERGLAGMLTSSTLDALRALNFGARTLQIPLDAQSIGAEIDRYDPLDAAMVCERIRSSATIDLLADQYTELYAEVAQTLVSADPARDLREFGESLSKVTPHIPLRMVLSPRRIEILNSRVLARPLRLARWVRRKLDL